ncbi:ATP-binding protein [Haloarchaeobius amylolyticus]|uniref:ATP-binding protein n=1 Tax=Haloarchaeobius amylolyticus TaxID=1198296 RepID=UPI00226D9F2A|nr:ATP-binding protein [Haloarchaeobius amylolyticus]
MTRSSGTRPADHRKESASSPVAVLLVASDDDPVGLDEDGGLDVTRVSTAAVDDALTDPPVPVDCVVFAGDASAAETTLETVRSVRETPFVLYAADPDPATLDGVLSAEWTEFVPRFDGADGSLLATRVTRLVERLRRERDHQLKDRALDQAGVGITIAGPDESLIYVNEGFEQLTGYDEREVLGENCRFLQGPDTDPEKVAAIRAAIDAEEPISIVLRNYDADGELFWNQLDISPVFDETGEVTHYFGFQKDVTEREQLARELGRQNERLDEFASVVSHDIRGPLSIATGHVEMAVAEESTDGLDAALEALERIERMVDDVLTLAREGEAVDEPAPVSLESIVTKAWQTGETGDLDIEVVDDLGMVEADASRLQTLFENLFRNAVDHATGATTVTIGRLGTEPGDDAGFYVADDGPGIDPAERESIFEQGFTTDSEGTGFGLAIVETIAQAHGWSVAVEASEAGGARFVVSGVEPL